MKYREIYILKFYHTKDKTTTFSLIFLTHKSVLLKYTVNILSNERSLALNDTDNRAEKGSLENKKIYFPGLVRFHGRGKRYPLGIGSVN